MKDPVIIDCDYLHPEFAAAYLVVEGSEAAFIEANTAHAVPRLLHALRTAGLTPDDVRYVIITHVHLDHAGGASALMHACPNASLLAHPRAAPHAIDPSRLVASARKVYGDETFKQLYGAIDPIPATRVRAMQDDETLPFGTRTLRFLHTRGHANHHFCVQDSGSDGIFTGDAFGLAYPALQQHGLFVFPSTSPTDFDPAEARASVRRIVDSGARRAFLTHFGEVDDLRGAAVQLFEHIDFSEDLLVRAAASSDTDEKLNALCERELRAHFERAFARRGLPAGGHAWDLVKLDIELNAQGIAFVAMKRRAGKHSAPPSSG